jgi:hypothetical protein
LKLIKYSDSAKCAEKKFFQISFNKEYSIISSILEKISACDYTVIIVSDDSSSFTINPHDKWINEITRLHEAWMIIRDEGMTNFEVQRKAWMIIDEIGGKVTSNENMVISPNLRRLQVDPSGKTFFVLLTGNEPDGLPIYEMSNLCNLWQLENRNIPIHASGIVHLGGLFLFGGISGAGKSTISRLSSALGDTIVDDDQLLLHFLGKGTYYASAWGSSLTVFDAPVRAIFHIIQDNNNLLTPLRSSEEALFLMEQVFQVTGKNLLSYNMLKKVFNLVSSIARSIPGYELHFTKTPDFWKLIDAEFSLN